jgi:hypothetical protein
MYQLELNTNELEYFTIFTAEELEGYSKEIPPTWLFEIIEWICIRIFNPKYNVAGKTLPFTFKDKITYANLELPRNYQDICKDLLLGEISEKDKEAIEALKENKVEEITDIGLE